MSSSVNTPEPRPQKIRLTFTILLVVVMIAAALFLSFGLGGKLIGDYNTRNYTVASQGTAIDAAQVDPHVTKVADEHKKVTSYAAQNNVNGIFERVYAGDYSYEKIDENSLGQYTIESFYFFENKDDSRKAYESILKYLNDLGYQQDESIEASESTANLLRVFVPSDEVSSASPGNDAITLDTYEKESGVNVIIFMFKSTELKLSGIPQVSNENYTVEQQEKWIARIVNGEEDGCDLTPNGVVGGWVPQYECYQSDL